MGQTVNLLAYAFGGSNPSLPTQKSNPIYQRIAFLYSYGFESLMYVAFVQRLCVTARVLQMLGIGHGKIMRPREVLFRTHI